MAIKNITATLNGGDAVTSKNDLIYKIYGQSDNYTTPIHTSGSHTSDSDVTVSGDSVTINNVDLGSETFIRITSVDEIGNESPQSDSTEVSKLTLLSDDFAGTTINTGKWTKTNPDTSRIVISQNNNLIFQSNAGSGTVSSIANNVTSVSTFYYENMVMRVDLTKTDDTNSVPSLGIQFRGNSGVDKIGLSNSAVGGKFGDVYFKTDVNSIVEGEGSSNPFNGSYKIVKTGLSWSFYRWDGSAWLQIGTTHIATTDGPYNIFMYIGATGTSPNQTFTVDNLYLTNYDFETLNPA